MYTRIINKACKQNETPRKTAIFSNFCLFTNPFSDQSWRPIKICANHIYVTYMHNLWKISSISSLVMFPLLSLSYNRNAHFSFSSTKEKIFYSVPTKIHGKNTWGKNMIFQNPHGYFILKSWFWEIITSIKCTNISCNYR